MRIKLLLTFLFFQIPYAQSEIVDKELIMTLFESCMSQQTSEIKTGAMLEYCACNANKISLGMDIYEVMLMEKDIYAAGGDEKKQAQIVLANKKMNGYIKDCLTRIGR